MPEPHLAPTPSKEEPKQGLAAFDRRPALPAMSAAQEIEQAAMKLPADKRGQSAERLFESLETKRDKKIAAAWADEHANSAA